jgi:hypothetical protein
MGGNLSYLEKILSKQVRYILLYLEMGSLHRKWDRKLKVVSYVENECL